LVPGCNDQSYLSCADVARQYGYGGIDTADATAIVNNKALFRAAARALSLSVPRVVKLLMNQTPDFPVIVKPVDSFSGKGVTVLPTPDLTSLSSAIDYASSVSRSGEFIIEEFIEGQLYSHSAFLVKHQVCREFWVIEHSSVNPFVVDTSHLAVDLATEIKDRLRSDIERFARAHCLVDGLFHTQFITDGSRYVIVEATRRCPGDLYSQLIQLATGFDYATAYVENFLGRNGVAFDSPIQELRFIMRHTLTDNFSSVPFFGLRFNSPLIIERWVPLLRSGDPLNPSPLGRIGILFAKTESENDLIQLARTTFGRALYRIDHGLH
jgi:hypothetical protein